MQNYYVYPEITDPRRREIIPYSQKIIGWFQLNKSLAPSVRGLRQRCLCSPVRGPWLTCDWQGLPLFWFRGQAARPVGNVPFRKVAPFLEKYHNLWEKRGFKSGLEQEKEENSPKIADFRVCNRLDRKRGL